MPWDRYASIIDVEWQALLSDPSTLESSFQQFFERHPCCLPQMYPTFRRGGHGPFPGAIISQPALPGFSKKVPDFLCITRDSATVYAVLIEIEHPRKAWATASGRSTAEFTQAKDQIADWKSWFKDPLNAPKFQELYQLPSDWVRSRTFEQRYFLIYGRRSEKTLTSSFNKKRKHFENPDEHHLTYDRIEPQRDLSWFLCAKVDKQGYKAVSVPPTLELGPWFADYWKMIREKEAAVKKNPYLSDARKKFLIDRWPYWDAWIPTGLTPTSYSE